MDRSFWAGVYSTIANVSTDGLRLKVILNGRSTKHKELLNQMKAEIGVGSVTYFRNGHRSYVRLVVQAYDHLETLIRYLDRALPLYRQDELERLRTALIARKSRPKGKKLDETPRIHTEVEKVVPGEY